MAKLGVNIVGGPDSHSIKVTNAETGDEIKGITGGTINLTLDGLTATFTVLVNHLDVKLNEIIVKEATPGQTFKPEWKYTDGTLSFPAKDLDKGIWMNGPSHYVEDIDDYNPGDSWT